jgi:DNA-binding CsgD family transcriptional regulator
MNPWASLTDPQRRMPTGPLVLSTVKITSGGRKRLANPWKLTRRQAEVMELMIDGGSNLQVSRLLGVSIKTVEAHLYAIYGAMGVTNRVQAILAWDRWARAVAPVEAEAA